MGVDYGNELESAEIVKLRARDKAIKNAVKQAGVGLKTYSRTINSELTDDEILTITSNTYELVGEVQYNRVAKQVNDQVLLVMWEATVNVNVDDAEVKKWFKRDDKKALIEQTKETQKLSAENDKKIEDLRKRADKVTGDKERAKLKAEFDATDKEFLYNQKIEEGNKFYYQKYYEEALNSFNEAIKINPNTYKAYYRRSWTYKSLGRIEAALDDLNKVIELSPKTSVYYYSNRASLYETLKQYDKALDDYNKMIELNPKNSRGYHGRASLYEKLNQKEKAIEEYTRAIKAEPTGALDYYCRADLYEKLGQYDKAIADLTKMIELNPQEDWIQLRRVHSYYHRAELYVKLNQRDKALAGLTECINIETDEAEKAKAYDNRGDFYKFTLNQEDKANTDYLKAVDFYTKAIASSNDTKKLFSCYTWRASLYEKIKQYDEAIADLTKAIELEPRRYYGYERRGNLYKKMHWYIEALADYAKAIEMEPGFKWLWEDYMRLCRMSRRYDLAIDFYTKLLETNPNIVTCYHYRGKCYEELGETAKAQADFAKYEELEGK